MSDIDDTLRTTDASTHLVQQNSQPESAQSDQSDRRRPGRTVMSPELISLAREVSDTGLVRDDAAPMRGIAFAVMLSAPIYIGLWLAARRLFF